MSAPTDRYSDARSSFRWQIPDRFNIASAILDRHAEATPDAPALIIVGSEGEPRVYSFKALQADANRLANALTALGLQRGDIIAIHLPQSVEALLAHAAVQKLGAIGLPMFNLFGPEAISYRLEDSGARALISTSEGLGRIGIGISGIASLAAVISVGGPAEGGTAEFWPLIARASDRFKTADTAAEDPALLMYTSGTTGPPKGVLHAGRVLLGHLPGVEWPHDGFPKPGDRFWTPADWAWAGGLLDVLLPSLYHGVPVVAATRARFDPDWALDLMARHDIRNVFMPPTALRLLRNGSDPRRYPLKLRSVGSGGETLGAEMLAWGQEALGLPINEFFGQTEVNLVVGNSNLLFPAKAGSMGRALPGHTVEVVDDKGTPLPPGEVGIIAVRAPDPVMFLSYWQKPEATAEKFRGPWCLLGDRGRKDEEGHFWYLGRDDDIISSAGYRIGPGEVEASLERHPAVLQAGVIGVPDKVRGEAVAAYVVLKPGFSPSEALAAEIQGFVKHELAAHEYPRLIRFLTELPVTVTGKVRRVELRQLERSRSGQ